MKEKLAASLIAVLALLSSCKAPEIKYSELLKTVPSDAIAIGVFSSFTDAAEAMPESCVAMASLDLGELARNDAVVGVSYHSSLEYMYGIDAGKADADTSAELLDVMARAVEAGFSVAVQPTGSRRALVLTHSESLMTEIRRHMESSASILDAPYFMEALSRSPETGVVYVRGDSFKRLLPKPFLSDYVPRKDLVAFLQSSADWLILGAQKLDPCSWDLRLAGDGAPSRYTSFVAGMPDGKSHLLLPEDSDFALDICVGDGFRACYENYLDANNRLSSYNSSLSAFTGDLGRKPQVWETEAGVSEVSLVRWEDHSVLMVRTKKEIVPCPGMLTVMYGSLFCLEDESCCERDGDWYVIGSAGDVKAWIAAEKPEVPTCWGVNGVKLQMFSPEVSISSSQNITSLNLNITCL